MGFLFGSELEPASGSGPVSSVVRVKLNHLKDILTKLTNWNTNSDLVTIHPDILRVPGELMLWPGWDVPTGWTLGDGLPRLRSAFPRMYQAYRNPNTGADLWPGGNGTTTFGTPPFPGRLIMCAGQGAGLTLRQFAAIFGEEAVAMIEANNGPHAHQIIGLTPGPGFSSVGQGGQPVSINNNSGLSGAGTPHNNIPPVVVITYCLKM